MKMSRGLVRWLLLVAACICAVSVGSSNVQGEEIFNPGAIREAVVRKKAEVLWSTIWFPAEVIEEKDGKYFIKYVGYGDVWNEWVGKDRIRFPGAAGAGAVARRAEVLWGGTWYPAKVLEQKEGKFYIKYDNYGDNWNEWVGMDRIRFPGKLPVEVVQVEIEWDGTWYPGKILEQKEGKYLVKYDGYSDASNEWVPKERIRMPAKPAAVGLGKVEVEWRGTWFPAQVLEQKGDRFYIKYDGYSDASNEWVGPDRIRAVKRVVEPKE